MDHLSSLPTNSTVRRPAWLALAILLLLTAACTRSELPAAQVEPAAAVPITIEAGETLGQSFLAAGPGLHRLDVHLAGSGPAPAAFTFILKAEQADGRELARLPIRPAANGLATITFPPLTGSSDSRYYLEIQPDPGQPLTLFISQEDAYQDGRAYHNGQPLDGDLLFTAYRTDNYTPSRIGRELLARLAQDRAFYIPYLFLIAATMVAIGFLFRWLPGNG